MTYERCGSRRLGLAVSLFVCLASCGPATSVNRSSSASEIGVSDGGDAGGDGGVASGGAGGTVSGSGGASGGGTGDGSGGAGVGGTIGTGGVGGTAGSGTGGSGGAGGVNSSGGARGDGSDAAIDQAPPADATVDTVRNTTPILNVSFALAGATTNLTNVGRLDWNHFGYLTATAVNKKKTSPGLITLKKIGSAEFGHYDDRPATLSWIDGTPKASATDVPDGIELEAVKGVGFEIRATGSTSKPRTLTVYVGGWQASAKFTAQLGTTATMYSNENFKAGDPGADRVYTIVFQPVSDSDTLIVRWTLTDTSLGGNVTLQAAALSE
jgi:hypothetical protein